MLYVAHHQKMTDEHTGIILFKDTECSISHDILNWVRICLYTYIDIAIILKKILFCKYHKEILYNNSKKMT